MKLAATLYLFAALIILAVDIIWLTAIARSIYVAEIGGLLKKSPDLVAALAFYVLYVAGLTFFVLMPSFEAGSVVRAALTGAFFGLVAYATYDLTNLATLEGFTTRIALIDMGWGAGLTALASAGAVWLAQKASWLA